MKNSDAPGFWLRRREDLADCAMGAAMVLAFAWLFYDSWIAVPFLTPLIGFWVRERRIARKRKADERFLKMFREWILLLASSLSAGYSVENALGQSCHELGLMFPKGGPMLDDLKEMLAKAENNQRPETLLEGLAEKRPFDEVRSFVEVFCTARISGGSLNAVIHSTASQMAQIMDTRREIRTLLASKVYEQKIMTLMPAAVLLYVRIGSADFVEGLYHNLAGAAVMTVCLAIYLAAYVIGERMVQFEI